jgi:hypothetical protein
VRTVINVIYINPDRTRATEISVESLLKIVPEALQQYAALAGAVELRRHEGWLDSRNFLVNRPPSFLDRIEGEAQSSGGFAVVMVEQREFKKLLIRVGKSEARAWADHGRAGPRRHRFEGFPVQAPSRPSRAPEASRRGKGVTN